MSAAERYLVWTSYSSDPIEQPTQAEAIAYADGLSDGVTLCGGDLDVWVAKSDGERERVVWRNTMSWSGEEVTP